jgi:hypothetical protein
MAALTTRSSSCVLGRAHTEFGRLCTKFGSASDHVSIHNAASSVFTHQWKRALESVCHFFADVPIAPEQQNGDRIRALSYSRI